MNKRDECDETFENESTLDTIERMGDSNDDPISVDRSIYK